MFLSNRHFLLVILLLHSSSLTTSIGIPFKKSIARLYDVFSTVGVNRSPGTNSCQQQLEPVQDLEKPVVLCGPNGELDLNALSNLHFLGWHGTIVKHIDSLHDSIRIFDPKTTDNNEESKPISIILRHGPGFYATDSVTTARYYQGTAYYDCVEKKEDINVNTWNGPTRNAAKSEDPCCAPAMCGIFTTKTFWNKVPKVFVRDYKDKANGILLRYNPPVLEKEISNYISRNKFNMKPLQFSEVTMNDMQTAVPKEHEGQIVAICDHDSVGEDYLNKYWVENVLSVRFNLKDERSGTLGKLFGKHINNMLRLNYWRYMKVLYNGQSDGNKGWAFEVIGKD